MQGLPSSILVTGATGNVGTSVVAALAQAPEVPAIVGLARRRPDWHPPRTRWIAADVAEDDLEPALEGREAVVHCAWLLRPEHDEDLLTRVNVEGTLRVVEAAARSGVRKVVYLSSVGTYAAHPGPDPVDESWPPTGIPTALYARHKAEVERRLDAVEERHPELRLVRLRPCLIFKYAAGPSQRRLFLGSWIPSTLLDPEHVPVTPDLADFRFQAVHADDVARAILASLARDVRGAFHVASEPVIDTKALASILDAPPVSVPTRPLRALLGATWQLRLQPSEPGWLDMALGAPLLDTGRARRLLDWRPTVSGPEAFRATLEGAAANEGFPTPPLQAES